LILTFYYTYKFPNSDQLLQVNMAGLSSYNARANQSSFNFIVVYLCLSTDWSFTSTQYFIAERSARETTKNQQFVTM